MELQEIADHKLRNVTIISLLCYDKIFLLLSMVGDIFSYHLYLLGYAKCTKNTVEDTELNVTKSAWLKLLCPTQLQKIWRF